MRVVSVTAIAVLLFLLGGCSDEGATNDFKDRFDELEERLDVLEETTQEQQETIHRQAELLQSKDADIEELQGMIRRLEHISESADINSSILMDLIHEITDSRTALVHEVNLIGDELELKVTYADFVPDPDAPNGFHLDEEETPTKLKVSKDVPVYWLDWAGDLRPMRIETEELVGKAGFAEFYERDGEVVFIFERYLP
ncbi:hypothetical protein GCM10008967_32980 [Bacillus carboniphilus]|uniref:Uncharacterized protein n=1 Tax=Bacillus carboniphilus TaxID=86663 RepID=A0ABP3GAS5_9BACI